jgi:hypothetical protein
LPLFDVTLAVFLTYICFDFAFSLSESESESDDESDEEVHDLIVILIHGDNIKFDDFILYLQSYVIKTKLYFT